MMRSAVSKEMWVGRAKKSLIFSVKMVVAAILVMSVLLSAVATRPAEAAFPGTNGKIVFSSNRDGNYEIYTMNADGTALTQVTNGPGDKREPAFSSDGSRIAFSSSGSIVLMNANGTGWVQLTKGSDPTFSPDGSKIAFVRPTPTSTGGDIFVMNTDGSGTPTNLTNDTPANSAPAWSPDGSKIAYLRETESAPDGSKAIGIYVMPSTGGDNTAVLRDSDPNTGPGEPKTGPAFSSNGSKIAFRHNGDIFVGNADGSGTPTSVTSGSAMDTQPDWGPLNFDLSLIQSDSADPAKVNNNLTYTLKVTNDGYDAAPGVVLTDKLPTGVTFVSASPGCSNSLGKVTCKLGSVAGVSPRNPTGTTLSRTITVRPTIQDTITNTASVKSSAVELTYTDNNSDRERTQVTLNRPPVANDNSYVTREDTPLTISAPGVLADDSDADSDQLTVSTVVETTSGGTLTLNTNGSFTYTPNANFNGADAFTYKATDGSAQSNVATVTIVVRAVNDAPNAADDSAQTETNTPLNINVLSNDRDPERDEMSITNISDPANGTATLNPDGTVRYAPDAGFTGSDPFTYTVSDGNGGTDTATLNIQVKDTIAPDAPVITSPANNSFDTDGSFTISGSAEPYTSVEIFDGGDSLNGAVAVNSEGTWSFELRNVSEGSHSYTAKAIDRAGNISTESGALTVTVDTTAPLVRG